MIRVEIENQLESYHIVSALLESREFEEERGSETDVEAIDSILVQFEGTAAGGLLEKSDDYECETKGLQEILDEIEEE